MLRPIDPRSQDVPRRSSPLRLIKSATGLVVVGLLLVSCSTPSAGALVEVVAENYAFTVPETVPAGLVTFSLTNAGSEPHAAQLYRLNDGITLGKFQGGMNAGIAVERSLATVVGGPANVDAGDTAPIVNMVLEPGTYAVVCWVPDSAGVPHVFLGMVASFEVTGEVGPTVSLPAAEGTFELVDYEIGVPDDFDGTGTFQVVNQGGEWHELVFAEIKEGSTVEEVVADINRGKQQFPASFASRGGVMGLEVGGGEATIDLDLDDGRYVIFCSIPSSSGVSHIALGMRTELTIDSG